ncbi:hypothetical protein LUZ60_018447 [Juncus effusus]|nr:hypothetical protein LUZ60_018447 [Juncus effusus]
MSVFRSELEKGRKAAGKVRGHWGGSFSSEFPIQIEAPIKKILRRLRDRGLISEEDPGQSRGLFDQRQRRRHSKLVRGYRDKSSFLLQVLRQPLSSTNDCRLPDPLVRYIHPRPQAQIFGASYNPKVPKDSILVNQKVVRPLRVPNSIELGKLGPGQDPNNDRALNNYLFNQPTPKH